jgi:dihydroorotase
MGSLLIRNGRVVDPSQRLDRVADVFVSDGRVAALGGAAGRAADRTIDATGLIVAPGLIDMHVHLREPGKAEEETIASGAAAAVAGGFASVACMPNTEPAIDSVASVQFVFLQAQRAGLANVFPIAAITRERKGQELAEIGQLSRAGAVGFSDDGVSVRNAGMMRRALEYAKMFDRAVIPHCEDLDLRGTGVMHEGRMSMILGLNGIPAASEEVMVARDLILSEGTGGRLHVAHVSTAGSVDLIRRARARGVPVTAEAAVHHIALTDEAVRSFDPVFKMDPPLRSRADVDALIGGLRDGTIDTIVSDHAPHAEEEKAVEFQYAPDGVIGMESLLGVVIKTLVEPGLLTWPQAISKLSTNPARILRLANKGTLAPGSDADVTVIDPKRRWTIDRAAFRSKSHNCPFHGWDVTGKAVVTVVGGEVKYSDL